jgi:hypothetical protein
MDDVIKLVSTYRLTAGLAERIRHAEQIFRLIGPDLHLFVFSHVSAMFQPCFSHVSAMFQPCFSHVSAMFQAMPPTMSFRKC